VSKLATVAVLALGITYSVFQTLSRNTDEKLYRSALQYPTTPTMPYNLALLLMQKAGWPKPFPISKACMPNTPKMPRFPALCRTRKRCFPRR
jgi:hypothetical protein